jgi:hypothetical protein
MNSLVVVVVVNVNRLKEKYNIVGGDGGCYCCY